MGKDDILTEWARARDAWPGVDLSAEDFAAYVKSRRAQTDTLHWEDLYLAFACARGDAAALATFERVLLPEINAALARIGCSASAIDEIRQQLRHKLFVAESGEKPKIEEYTGRGALGAWLRMAATRMALNAHHRAAKESSADEDGLAFLIGSGEDAELQYFKRLYTQEFKSAFGAAFQQLETRERTLLRYAFSDGLTVDAIGKVFNVHRATAARWVAKAHASLVNQVREALMARLNVGRDDYASILRLIESQMEISLSSYLGGPLEAEGGA